MQELLNIEVNEMTVGSFKIVHYIDIVDVHC